MEVIHQLISCWFVALGFHREKATLNPEKYLIMLLLERTLLILLLY